MQRGVVSRSYSGPLTARGMKLYYDQERHPDMRRGSKQVRPSFRIPSTWLTVSMSVLVLAFTGNLYGQFTVSPNAIFLNAPTQNARLVVANQADSSYEAWVEFRLGFPAMDDSGKVRMVYDSSTASPRSAVSWLRAYPQRFFLEVGGSQTVTIISNPPGTLGDGEYWARVIVATKLTSRIQVLTDRVRTNVSTFSGVDIPFHYRTGHAFTGLAVGNVEGTVDGTFLRVVSDFTLQGNSAYWGKVTMRLLDNNGQSVSTKEQKIAVYQSLRFVSFLDVANVPRGQYTLELDFSNKRTDVVPKAILQVPEFSKSAPVLIE